MLKKSVSILLAVLMVVSALVVGAVSAGAETEYNFTPDPGKLYFDTANTGWTMGSKNKVAFRVYDGDIPEGVDYWGSKKVIGTLVSGTDTVYEIDLKAKVGLEFTPGVQYKIIFVRTDGNNWTDQCYDLFMTSDCLGHVAYGDKNIVYENPVDSSKVAIAAFWNGLDPTEYGPVLQISSIGNVVGTCLAQGQTKEEVFVDFLTLVDEKMGVTKLRNARKYTVESGRKTEQQMIDDIGEALGFTKDDVKKAFDENPMDKGIADPDNPDQYTVEPKEVTTTWDYDASTLPGGTPPEYIRGDANSDEALDTVDVTTIQRKIAEFPVPVFDEKAADADKDEIVDIIDATLIQRVLANMTTFAKWDAKHPRED